MTTTLPLAGSADELGARLAGKVLSPADPGYHQAGAAWNLSYRHSPAIAVIPESAADVAAAVSYAVSADLKVTVQATGHGVAKVADGGMLILTTNLNDVAIDAEAWTARIGAGAKWEKVLGPATEVGLAPLLGSTPDVSAVGYTLGGGMGWLARKYGLSADHVRSIEIVTPEGKIRRASPNSETDLFWALRGAGAGSFGVVTAIEIDLVPVQSLYAGNLVYPASIVREVAVRYKEWIQSVPDDLTSAITMMNFPPEEDLPEPLRGRSFVIVRGAYDGDDTSGEELLRFWRDWRSPILDSWGRMPFSEIATVSNDPVDPLPGLASTEWFDDLDEAMIEILAIAMFEQGGSSPLVMAEIRHAGGAISREPEYPNSYGNRQRQHVLEVVGIAMDDQHLQEIHGFVTELQRKLTPFKSGGAYLNFLEGEEKIRRTREGFDDEAWVRLVELKKRFDPENYFDRGIAIY